MKEINNHTGALVGSEIFQRITEKDFEVRGQLEKLEGGQARQGN